MLAKISDFFQSLNEQPKQQSNEVSLEMACAVLLCEVMLADGKLDDSEQAMLEQMLCEHFSLTHQEVSELIHEAKVISEHAVDFHQFTSKVNTHYTAEQKTQMVTLLWQLALADGKVSSIEEHMIRKIADLLHLSRAEYIKAKNIIKADK